MTYLFRYTTNQHDLVVTEIKFNWSKMFFNITAYRHRLSCAVFFHVNAKDETTARNIVNQELIRLKFGTLGAKFCGTPSN